MRDLVYKAGIRRWLEKKAAQSDRSPLMDFGVVNLALGLPLAATMLGGIFGSRFGAGRAYKKFQEILRNAKDVGEAREIFKSLNLGDDIGYASKLDGIVDEYMKWYRTRNPGRAEDYYKQWGDATRRNLDQKGVHEMMNTGGYLTTQDGYKVFLGPEQMSRSAFLHELGHHNDPSTVRDLLTEDPLLYTLSGKELKNEQRAWDAGRKYGPIEKEVEEGALDTYRKGRNYGRGGAGIGGGLGTVGSGALLKSHFGDE